jgi:hypothetical protein
MKLALFDFDNTLFETPYNEDPIYMDRPQSLSTSKWKFKPILETINSYEINSTCDNTKLILLTNRISDVYLELKSILESHGLRFDEYMTIVGADGDRSKGNRLKSLIEKYGVVTEVEYWEDKDKHIVDVMSIMESYPNIVLKINKVTI